MTRDVVEMCPHCGKRLMLCDECQHDEDGVYIGGCDYDRTTDSCKHNRVEVEADG